MKARLALILFLQVVVTQAQLGTGWRVTSGGGVVSAGGVYTVSATVGQPDAFSASGGNFTFTGGFWSARWPVRTDTNPPQLFVPSNLAVPCTSPAGAVVNFSVTASDAVDTNPIIHCVPPSGSLMPIGFTTVNCTAIDRAGNQSSASFTVQVTGACDTGCLAISCPSDITVNLGSQPTVPVSFAVTAVNTCSGQTCPVICNPPPGSQFPPGTNPVTCVASAGGASNTCTFSVIVRDISTPQVQTPGPIVTTGRVTNTLGQVGAYVFFQANAFHNSGVTLSYSQPPGSFFAVGTNTVTCFARDNWGNVSSKTLNVIVATEPLPGLANADNWGFENQIFSGWTASGNAFDDQPVTGDYLTVKRIPELQQQLQSQIGGDYWMDLFYPVGHKGDNWICTAFVLDAGPGGNRDDQFDETLTGTLLSKSFALQKRYLTFLIGGAQDQTNLQVQLLVQPPDGGQQTVQLNGVTYGLAATATGHGRELMRREFWDVSSQLGKTGRIRILDNSPTGHLNVDDFQFQDQSPAVQTITIGGKNYPALVSFDGHLYDWDSPVWGFADLHTHPMSYLGFGGKMLHGRPDGGVNNVDDIASALSDCKTNHGGWGLDNPQGNYWRQILMIAEDDKGLDPHREGWHSNGWMQFRNWPVFTTVAHQQMWYEWIKRAYDGGLRAMVALCVNSRLLAVLGKGDPNLPVDDQAVGDLQITELKNFVSRHSDFMEIAYDPFQFRDIVRRDKLAIIIGTELDDIGDFARNPNIVRDSPDPASQQAVRAEIGRLYTNGVRYVFPVHLVNNKFGGTAIAGTLLNVASKYLNGEGFSTMKALPEDNIEFALKNLDLRAYIDPNLPPDLANLILAAGGVLGGPLIPLLVPWIGTTLVSLPAVPPGSGGALSGAVAPMALLGAASVLPPLLTMIGVDQGEVVQAIIPLPGNYPLYPFVPPACNDGNSPSCALYGVRNALGLTSLGTNAVRELMSRGMMIDIDHMSQLTLDSVFAIAKSLPVGYPLNSGHNGFRELGLDERPENLRSPAQLANLVQLGGVMGLGWENGDFGTFVGTNRQFGISQIANDCAGTAKTFGQSYLYSLEKLQGRNIGLGTDIDGVIPLPGPRFGPQSAFGLNPTNLAHRYQQVQAQANGVLYSPQYGLPLTTGAFRGSTVDVGNQSTDASTDQGFVYNEDQADFYAAIRMYYWLKPAVAGGLSQNDTVTDLDTVAGSLSDNYPQFWCSGQLQSSKTRIEQYAFGLLAGVANWPVGGWDAQCDKIARFLFGKALYRFETLQEAPPPEVTGDTGRWARLQAVWRDYHKVFGNNAPLKPCQTLSKQWDVNFEGVAHYGLLPDFIQDLSNVGLQPSDLSVLFRSADAFAQMWTRCLEASYAFKPHFAGTEILPGNVLRFSFTPGDEGFTVEQADNLVAPLWQPVPLAQIATNGFNGTVTINPDAQIRFYRLRK